MPSRAVLLIIWLLTAAAVSVRRETLVIEEWVVDYLRPTADASSPFRRAAARRVPFKIPEGERGVKYLINGTYPGPTIHANEHDMLEITVINKLFSEATTIHWHGIHPLKQPYMDGARDVTQAPILPGESFTYRFDAYPPGTHYCARTGLERFEVLTLWRPPLPRSPSAYCQLSGRTIVPW